MKLSVIAPMYNEGIKINYFLGKMVPFLERNYKDWELIIIDDGSTDSTLGIIRNFSKKNNKIKVVSHMKNMGVGAALRTGLKQVSGDIIVTIDSDLTYSPTEIPKLIEKLRRDDADIVIGTPYLKNEDHKEIPFIRYLASRTGNFLDEKIFGLNFTTPTCFFRAWRKSAIKKIEINFNRFEGIPESAIKAHKMRLKISEVPVKYNLKRSSKLGIDIKKNIRNTAMHIKMVYNLLSSS